MPLDNYWCKTAWTTGATVFVLDIVKSHLSNTYRREGTSAYELVICFCSWFGYFSWPPSLPQCITPSSYCIMYNIPLIFNDYTVQYLDLHTYYPAIETKPNLYLYMFNSMNKIYHFHQFFSLWITKNWSVCQMYNDSSSLPKCHFPCMFHLA